MKYDLEETIIAAFMNRQPVVIVEGQDDIKFYDNIASLNNISVDVQNINVGDNATIIATLPANATGNVTFTVNNKEYIVAIEKEKKHD